MNSFQELITTYRRSDYEETFKFFTRLVQNREEVENLDHPDFAQLLKSGALASYFIGRPELGLRLFDLYYLFRSTPTRSDYFSNLSFCTTALSKGLSFENAPSDWMIQDENGIKLSMTNAAGFLFKGKQYLLVRVVNYLIKENGYLFLDGSRIVKTRYVISEIVDNKIVQFKFLTVKPDHEIYENLWDKYTGLEDLRPLVWRGRVKVFGSSADVHLGKIGIFMADLDVENLYIENLIPMSFCNGPVEKNWLPFVHDDKLYCIYSFNPFIILRIFANGSCKEVKRIFPFTPRFGLIGHRGGSILDFGTGYLIMCHYTSSEPLWRNYYRRFILMDYQFNLVSVSAPFCFEKKKIEYSLCIFEQSQDNFEIYYSIADNSVKIIRLTREQITQMLIPIDQYLDLACCIDSSN